MSLVIAAPTVDAVAETYVRQHIARIAPGCTQVVFQTGSSEPVQHVPYHRIATPTAGSYAQRLGGLLNLLRYGYPGALTGDSASALQRELNAWGCTALLAEFGPVGCMLAPVCRALDLPLYVFFHGHDATVMPRRRVIRHAYSRLAKQAAGIFCGSRYFAGRLEALGFVSERVHVTPQGVDLSAFRPGDAIHPKLLLAVGRFTHKKAPALTLKSAINALAAVPDAKLEMIGDGPLLGACQALVERSGMADRITLHGAKPPEFVQERMRAAGAFVQHSITAPNGDTESQGLSLVEAMACGLPIITTRHNGFPELVTDGENGFLVQEGNTATMTARLVDVLTDQDLRTRLGANARHRAEQHFDIEQHCARLRELMGLSL